MSTYNRIRQILFLASISATICIGFSESYVNIPSTKIHRRCSKSFCYSCTDKKRSFKYGFALIRGGGFVRSTVVKSISAATEAVCEKENIASQILSNFKAQYKDRIRADQSFLKKSILEIFVATGTQFLAELNRRGRDGLLLEIDFVFAGVLTAVVGKYYSMWRVAPTVSDTIQKMVDNTDEGFWGSVPTNAFQRDRDISYVHRCAAIVAPMPTLFRAGVLASSIGYGITSILIAFRSILLPEYIAQTQNVNIFSAMWYTGAFMAVVSNLRYQLLQGLIEPIFIDKPLKKYPKVRALLIFILRWANGLLGSILAISGMKALGLQKLKS